MKVRDLFQAVRQHYVDHYEATLEASREPGCRLMIEKALRRADDEEGLATTPIFGLPFRADLLVFRQEGQEGEEKLVDPGSRLDFEPFLLEWKGGLEIEVHPFVWSRLSITSPEASAAELSSPDHPVHRSLVAWYEKWFDAVREREGIFLGVAHYLSDPEPLGPSVDEPGVRFLVDLGSAPVDALLTLFDALVPLGPGRLVLDLPSGGDGDGDE